MAAGQGGLDERLRSAAEESRRRANEFYEYAFLPPSVTRDDEPDIEGPQKPPSEPRVVTDEQAAGPSPADRLRSAAGNSRQRANEFYEYAFLPPSMTDEEFGLEPTTTPSPDEYGGFAFTDWLNSGRPSGPQQPPAEARVVTDVDAEAVAVDQEQQFEFGEWLGSEELTVEAGSESDPEPTVKREYGEFAFTEWLADGENDFEPVVFDESESEPEEPVTPEEPSTPGIRPQFGIKPHPAKAATYALFFAVLTLMALSAAGLAPVLGPATGLGG